jgi:hypothetical protein
MILNFVVRTLGASVLELNEESFVSILRSTLCRLFVEYYKKLNLQVIYLPRLVS